jgi:hypothetical protein
MATIKVKLQSARVDQSVLGHLQNCIISKTAVHVWKKNAYNENDNSKYRPIHVRLNVQLIRLNKNKLIITHPGFSSRIQIRFNIRFLDCVHSINSPNTFRTLVNNSVKLQHQGEVLVMQVELLLMLRCP